MQVRVGTSGYSYPQWRGSFYPEGMKAEEMLAFYATRFGSVEINNTFYRMPKREVVARWAEEVRARGDFVFVLKASQRITHTKRLANAESEVAFFTGNALALGPALGPLLFQLPPFMRKDAARLGAFLGTLPAPHRAAFEFRHASWHDDEVRAALRDHGAALVLADTDEERLTGALAATADFGYLRLRRVRYSDDELADWAARVRAVPWKEAFVFFKHEEDGPEGPAAAERFLALLGGGAATA